MTVAPSQMAMVSPGDATSNKARKSVSVMPHFPLVEVHVVGLLSPFVGGNVSVLSLFVGEDVGARDGRAVGAGLVF